MVKAVQDKSLWNRWSRGETWSWRQPWRWWQLALGQDEAWLEGCQCLAPAVPTAHFTPLWSTCACMILVQSKTCCWGLSRHEKQEEHLGRSEVQSRFAAALRAQPGWVPCDHTGGMKLFPKLLLSFVLLSGGHQWLCWQLSSKGPYQSALSSQSLFSCVTGEWQQKAWSSHCNATHKSV